VLPTGKKTSGSSSRQAASCRQSIGQSTPSVENLELKLNYFPYYLLNLINKQGYFAEKFKYLKI
jgi:hypothetical protein